MRNKYSILKISQSEPRDLIDDMSKAHFSLLRSFGCGIHNFWLFWVRFACLFFIKMAERRAEKRTEMDRESALRLELGKIFQHGAPSIVGTSPDFPDPDYGLVIGFNHPSLGEILRLMYICMLVYPERKYLFPVNILWYEALVPVIDRLAEFGFTLMPVITPKAKKKLMKHAKKIEARVQVNRLTRGFVEAYFARSTEFVKSGQIVLVAPSATRKQYVFDDKATAEGKKPIEPQTMTLLALSIMRAKIEHFAFIPVAIIPPEGASRGLNLLCEYRIMPCNPMSEETIIPRCKQFKDGCNARRFERCFLEAIAKELESNNRKDLITRPG